MAPHSLAGSAREDQQARGSARDPERSRGAAGHPEPQDRRRPLLSRSKPFSAGGGRCPGEVRGRPAAGCQHRRRPARQFLRALPGEGGQLDPAARGRACERGFDVPGGRTAEHDSHVDPAGGRVPGDAHRFGARLPAAQGVRIRHPACRLSGGRRPGHVLVPRRRDVVAAHDRARVDRLPAGGGDRTARGRWRGVLPARQAAKEGSGQGPGGAAADSGNLVPERTGADEAGIRDRGSGIGDQGSGDRGLSP